MRLFDHGDDLANDRAHRCLPCSSIRHASYSLDAAAANAVQPRIRCRAFRRQRISPHSRNAAPSISPRRKQLRARVAAPASSASAISCLDNSPTSRVTRRAPRSLSGCSSFAGQRMMAGCPGRSTALAMMVAAASACDAVARQHGHGIGNAERKAAAVAAAGRDAARSDRRRAIIIVRIRPWRSGRSIRPTVNCSPSVKMQRDVAAIIDIGARRAARRCSIAPRISSATLPATAAIGVMK